MLVGGMSPNDIASARVTLSAEHSRLDEKLVEILSRRPAIWNSMRMSQKSDTATNNIWAGTADGLEEMKIRHRQKSIILMIGALSSMLRVKEAEAKNLF